MRWGWGRLPGRILGVDSSSICWGKKMMSEFMNGQDVTISFLARCTRYIFAHGVLTANSPNLSAKRFDQVSQLLSDFLLTSMDQDFENRVP